MYSVYVYIYNLKTRFNTCLNPETKKKQTVLVLGLTRETWVTTCVHPETKKKKKCSG